MSATDAGGPLDLHMDLYPRAAIDAAVAAFSRFGTFVVEVRAPYHRVLLPAQPAAGLGAGLLAREFANYALAAAALASAPAEGDGAA